MNSVVDRALSDSCCKFCESSVCNQQIPVESSLNFSFFCHTGRIIVIIIVIGSLTNHEYATKESSYRFVHASADLSM